MNVRILQACCKRREAFTSLAVWRVGLNERKIYETKLKISLEYTKGGLAKKEEWKSITHFNVLIISTVILGMNIEIDVNTVLYYCYWTVWEVMKDECFKSCYNEQDLYFFANTLDNVIHVFYEIWNFSPSFPILFLAGMSCDSKVICIMLTDDRRHHNQQYVKECYGDNHLT